MRSNAPRSLYAVNEPSGDRGSISVYDIDAGHRLIKTIQTVPGVGDVKGVAVSAVTGKLFVAYRDVSGTGMVYCLDVYSDSVLWNRAIPPGVDRLAIHPNGKLLIVPTWEGGSADYINVVDANTGDSPIGAHLRATDLCAVGSLDPDHDAVMRIGGEAPGGGPILSVGIS